MSFQKMFLRSLLLSAALNMVLMSPGFGMETDDSDTAAVKARMHRYVVAAFRASSEVRKRELGEVKADSHPTTRNFAEETEIFESFFAALSAQKEKPRISERVILTETAARLVVTSLAEGGMGAYFLPATLRLILKESVRYIQTPEGRVQAGAALVDGPLSSDKRLV